MEIKIFSLAIIIAFFSVACKQGADTDNIQNSQPKTSVQKKNTANARNVKSNQNNVKSTPVNKSAQKVTRNNTTVNNKNIANNNTKSLANTKKVASKKVVNPAQQQRDALNKIKNAKIPTGKVNTPAYYSALKRNLELSDNKLRGLEGINRQFDKKIGLVPKVNGKTNLDVLRKINNQRQNTIKQYLGDGLYRQKIVFDQKFSKK